jgi:HK97 family phage prohead protease
MESRKSVSFEIKSIGAREFEGYGSIFGNRDLGGDIVLQGAFARSLAEHRKAGTLPVMYWMHQPDQVPGVWLEMAEDKAGLYVRGETVDTVLGRDVHTLLKKQAVRGLSMGYRTIEADWDADGNRLLKQVELHEVSVVSRAMNPLAKVEAVKARLSADGEYVPSEREIEQHFREMGCSRKVAKQLLARLFEGSDASGTLGGSLRDAGKAGDEDDGQLLALLGRLTDVIGAQAISARM